MENYSKEQLLDEAIRFFKGNLAKINKLSEGLGRSTPYDLFFWKIGSHKNFEIIWI